MARTFAVEAWVTQPQLVTNWLTGTYVTIGGPVSDSTVIIVPG